MEEGRLEGYSLTPLSEGMIGNPKGGFTSPVIKHLQRWNWNWNGFLPFPLMDALFNGYTHINPLSEDQIGNLVYDAD